MLDGRPLAFGQRARGRSCSSRSARPACRRPTTNWPLPPADICGLAVGRDLGVPGIVELAGFHHRAGRAAASPPPLIGHGREGGLGRVAVVRVGGQGHHVVHLEAGDDEGAGADRHEVLASVQVGAAAPRQLANCAFCRIGDSAADEGGVGVRLRPEGDLDGQVVDGLDRGHALDTWSPWAQPPSGWVQYSPGEDHVIAEVTGVPSDHSRPG
jgi:hypothetical protein